MSELRNYEVKYVLGLIAENERLRAVYKAAEETQVHIAPDAPDYILEDLETALTAAALREDE